MSKILYVDTETTGLKPGQIGQYSAILQNEDGSVVGKNYFFEVKNVCDDVKTKLGRDEAFYLAKSGGQKFADKALSIHDDINGSLLIAHNAPFDIKFLSFELWKCGIQAQPSQVFDTMREYKNYVGAVDMYNRPKNPRLEQVIDKLGINTAEVLSTAKQLFNSPDDFEYHDSRFDTACLFVMVNVMNEIATGTRGAWSNRYVQ